MAVIFCSGLANLDCLGTVTVSGGKALHRAKPVKNLASMAGLLAGFRYSRSPVILGDKIFPGLSRPVIVSNGQYIS